MNIVNIVSLTMNALAYFILYLILYWMFQITSRGGIKNQQNLSNIKLETTDISHLHELSVKDTDESYKYNYQHHKRGKYSKLQRLIPLKWIIRIGTWNQIWIHDCYYGDESTMSPRCNERNYPKMVDCTINNEYYHLMI